MSKLYSLGELLIDFQSVGYGNLKSTEQFKKKAGGAPANVCAQAVRMGSEAVYLTKVGDDGFGEFLIEALKDVGIDTSYIKKDKNYNTSLAFVSFEENGEREFSFYRKSAADLYFTNEDFKDIEFSRGDILEFGSVALQTETARNTHCFLIEEAKRRNAIIAFDPNIRLNLWDDKEELRRIVNDFYPVANVMKIGVDELEFVTGKSVDEGIKIVLNNKNIKILLLTDGSKGAKLYVKDKCYSCPGYKVKTVDTTGAGDSFFGAFLGQLLKKGIGLEELENLDNDYQEMLNFSCKAGAYTTTQYGAIQIMGDIETIERMVK